MDPNKPWFPSLPGAPHMPRLQQQARGRGLLPEEPAVGRARGLPLPEEPGYGRARGMALPGAHPAVQYGRGRSYAVSESPVGFARGLVLPDQEGRLGRARGLLLSTTEPSVGLSSETRHPSQVTGFGEPGPQVPPDQPAMAELPEDMPGLQAEEEDVPQIKQASWFFAGFVLFLICFRPGLT